MNSASDSWWPYVLMTVFWILVCGYFLRRAWRAQTRLWKSADGLTMLPERRSPHRVQDTQAGRI
jgi:TRAP-type C4-dicarboxylate transport system permease small subunit